MCASSSGPSPGPVGTASEVFHYLRLLWARLGEVHCPRCGLPGKVVDASGLAVRVAEDFPGGELAVLAPLGRRRRGFPLDVIAAAGRKGVAEVRIDGAVYDASQPPRVDRFQIHDVEAVVERVGGGRGRLSRLESAVARALDLGAGSLLALGPGGAERLYSTRRSCPSCGAGLPAPDPRLFAWSQKYGACPECDGFGTPRVEEEGEWRG